MSQLQIPVPHSHPHRIDLDTHANLFGYTRCERHHGSHEASAGPGRITALVPHRAKDVSFQPRMSRRFEESILENSSKKD
jgi:hypothetical protein